MNTLELFLTNINFTVITVALLATFVAVLIIGVVRRNGEFDHRRDMEDRRHLALKNSLWISKTSNTPVDD